jgi:hypothetical protein
MADVDGANVVVADAGAEATGGLGPERALARCSFLAPESLVLDWLLAALTAGEAEASPRFGQMGLVHGVAHSGEGSLSSTRFTHVWLVRDGRWQLVATRCVVVTQRRRHRGLRPPPRAEPRRLTSALVDRCRSGKPHATSKCNVHVDAVHRLSGQSPSLPCELRSSADPARLGRPRSLCFPFLDRRVEQVAHHLPPAGGITVEQPLDYTGLRTRNRRDPM